MTIPVCWMSSSGEVRWGNIIALEDQAGAKIVRFDDGGWNPLESCFLTEAQCRSCKEKPPRNLLPTVELTIDKLAELTTWLQTNVDKAKERKP